ncbi:MAG: PVC-type heme-binding CxxCH protein [Pirellula sp.]
MINPKLARATLLQSMLLGCIFSVWSYAQEPIVDKPLAPEEAARTMVLPEGFQATLFAGEPDVRQPIGFCIDDRGRLWVAEAFNYPVHGTTPGDRILIFEDTDGDGRFDKRKVFYDQLNYVSGIEVGFGGAWVMSPPYFYFIPDRNGDDVPDSTPEVLLDGFGNHANSHNIANGFAWGPDGWLYGTHGRTNWSRIGKPGANDSERIQYDGGVYRYHPIRHVWEPYADGTTNPWGIDWNEYGEGFVCNCVNPHLFHVIQGAHYEPWRNRASSQHAYARIDTIADHLHFVGKQNVRDGLGSHEEDAAGGGHAHCGTMVYLGDNWPDEYRNDVFMNNIHGKRINHDRLSRSGSGYIASHAPDVMRSRDPWHMGVTLQYGPDGGVFVLDWSDTGECHSVRNTRKETGRIFKVTYGTPNTKQVNLAELTDLQLVNLHAHRNEWYVRHSRRLLQERMAKGSDMKAVRNNLLQKFTAANEIPLKLRALWTLHALGGLESSFWASQLAHANEHIRAWAVRFLCEDNYPSAENVARLAELAAKDPSPIVRLYLASAVQRLPAQDRWSILESLMLRGEDAGDANLPLMIWYGLEPLVDTNAAKFLACAQACKIPLVREHIARRAASSSASTESIRGLVQMLGGTSNSAIHLDLLRGTLKGLEGRRSVDMPVGWTQVWASLQNSSHRQVKQLSTELALLFNDANALKQLSVQAVDKKQGTEDRQRAISALVAKKYSSTADLLLGLLEDQNVNQLAIRGLAEFDHPATASTLLKSFQGLPPAARQDALQTLASRKSWATSLLDAMETGTVPRKVVSAYTIRQLHSLGDTAIIDRVRKVWGEIRTSNSDKAKQISDLKKRLSPTAIASADLSNGRAMFEKHCAACHRLFDSGGKIGPDITGAQRTNLDYLLENLIDPSASVAKDFQMELILTKEDRVVTGLVVSENEMAVTIQTVNEQVVIPKNEIESRKPSQASLMPDGILQPFSFSQIRDLMGYLSSPSQVDLPRALP